MFRLDPRKEKAIYDFVNACIGIAVNAKQRLVLSAIPTSGSFKIGYNGVFSTSIAWNASDATIKTAIQTITGISEVTVATLSTTIKTIEFTGVDAGKFFEPLTCDSSLLLAGSSVITNDIEILKEGKPALTIIWDKQTTQDPIGAVLPDLPFATMNISKIPTKVGTPTQRNIRSGDDYKYRFNKELTLTVNIYADDMYLKYLEQLLNCLEIETKLDILSAEGISVLGYSDPNDISELLESKYEFRCQVDIQILYGYEVIDTTGYIDTVEVDGDIDGVEVTETINP